MPYAVECELGERTNGDACGALRLIRLGVLGPRGAGDVQVGPRQIARELLDEERGGDRAARAAAGVREIGDFALELLEIVGGCWHRPRAIACSFARAQYGLHPRVR